MKIKQVGSSSRRPSTHTSGHITALAVSLFLIACAPVGVGALAAEAAGLDGPPAVENESESSRATGPAATSPGLPAAPEAASPTSGGGWLDSWLRRAAEARASQPHTAAPLVTTHNALVQQFRYDGYVQQDPSGTWTTNSGVGRGIEIIPTNRMEIAFAVPPYLTHQSTTPSGFGDWSLLVKFRAFSAPEGKGAYYLGFVLNGTFPTGSAGNSTGHTVWSPAVAFGKGWGNFNLQNTFGGTLPQTGASILGRTIVLNDVAQYRIKRVIWPMLEANSTFWSGGRYAGQHQVFLTPGIVIGSFPITPRLRIAVGAGEQIAVTHFCTYNHRYILSLRLPFG